MASGKIIGLFAILLYVLVTLMPDIHGQTLVLTPHLIAYPFVVWWQGGLILMIVLFLLRLYPQDRPFYLFGHGIDRWILSLIVIVCLSSLLGEFKPQAIWQSGILLAFTTIGYSLWQELKINSNPIGLLKFQSLLQFVYIVESLILWITAKIVPHIKQVLALREEGIVPGFSINDLNLHNSFPSGDSDYVAGYVILALPLLFVLGLTEKGFWQNLGIIGFILGLIDLYSTSSLPGYIGLSLMSIAFLVLLLCRSRLTMGAFLTVSLLLLVIGLSNSYIRETLFNFVSGAPHHEFFYRSITTTIGIAIGSNNWLLGAGVGSTPLLYQKYRPEWALDQGEIDFQLHSLPVQIFSELGIAGIFLICWGLFLVIGFCLSKSQLKYYRNALVIGLTGYVFLSLFDYQLDVMAIAITLVIYCVVVFYLSNSSSEKIFPHKYRKLSALSGWALLLGGLIWVTPIDFAWHLSSQGFLQLRNYQNSATIEEASNAFIAFQSKLVDALKFAPWESYYSNQLGWNLGLKGWNERDQSLAQQYQTLATKYLQTSIKVNPYQEFSFHQLAWLFHNLADSQAAQPMFEQALSLLPSKASLNFGLGLSLIRLGKDQLGINSIVKECFYHPLFITSPLWHSQQLQGIYPIVMTELAKLYQTQKQDLNLAVLNWWLGKPGAVSELRAVKQPITDLLADTIEDKREKLQRIIDQPKTSRDFLISAWYNPNKRKELLRKAWISATGTLEVEPIVEALTVRMNITTSFDEFLRSSLPLFTPLSLKKPAQRQGFGIVSRHIDGPDPYDLFVIEKNGILAYFWKDLFPPPSRLY